MTELHLNGLPAVLPSNLNIKVNHENVYLTAAGQYTYDIELPLLGCPQNLAIFGHINRIDARRRTVTLSALLTASGKVILKGSALITSITRTSVKVQLLGGNSELNFFGRGEGKYINEMGIYCTHTLDTIRGDRDIPDAAGIESWHQELYGQYPTNDFVYFPIWNESLGGTMNRRMYNVRTDKDGLTYPSMGASGATTGEGRREADIVAVSPQPYLCWLIKEVIGAMGYTLVQNDMEGTPLQQIFVCMPCNSKYISKYLPHWTVNDFFRRLEEFLGMVLVVDDVQKTARLVAKRTFFTDNVEYLDNVIDDFELEVDEDEEQDVTTGRVGYADNGQPVELNFPAAVIQKSTIVQTDIDGWGTEDSASDRVIWEHEGRRYIHWTDDNGTTWYARMVDQARPRPAQGDEEDDRTADLDVELKFVPARTTTGPIMCRRWKYYERNMHVENEATVNIPVLFTAGVAVENRPVRGTSSGGFTIQEYLADESLIEDSVDVPDYIEVAYNCGTMHVSSFPAVLNSSGEVRFSSVQFPYWWGKTFLGVMGYAKIDSQDLDFSLVDTGGVNIYTLCHSGLLSIDKTAKRCIRFLAQGSVDPKKLFIIRGKRFVCEKIERQVDAKGMQPLATGYFYEVNE